MMKSEVKRKKEEVPTIGNVIEQRTDKASPLDHPGTPYIGLDDVEAHTTKLLGHKDSASMKSSAKVFKKGDLLYSRLRPYLNKVWLADRDGLCSAEFIILPPNEFIDGKFLKYRISARDFVQFANSLNAGDRPRVDFKGISSFILPPFSLAHQRHIVAKIEELFSELDAGEQSLRDARHQLTLYRQSLLKQAFEGKLTETWRANNPDKLESPETLLAHIQVERESRHQQQLQTWQQAVDQWEQNGKEGKKPTKPRKLLDIISYDDEQLLNLPPLPEAWTFHRLDTISAIGSGVSVSKSRQVSNPVEVPYLRVANVQRGVLKLKEIKTMVVDKLRLETLKIRHDDVLFNEGGDIDKLGRGWVWKSQIETCITQNHVFRATMCSTELIIPEFVSHWGNAFGQDFFFKGGKQTTNLASISKTTLSSLPVPVPPPLEQQEILRILELQFTAIEQNEKEINHALTQSQALRQSILKKAFEGSLVAQDSEDETASELLERIQRDAQSSKIVTKPKKKVAKKKSAKIPVGATDLQAGLVALAAQAHQEKNVFFGHTKAEKFIHLASALADLDLGRIPRQEAAGPNDFPRAKKVEHRARMKKWFNTKKEGEIYHYHIGPNSTQLIEATKQKLGHNLDIIQKLLQEVLKMDTRQAEIFATVYAAWNNLLIQDKPTDEESIVIAAREEWHENKLNIGRQKFFAAILWIRGHGFAPTGSGRLVIKPDLT